MKDLSGGGEESARVVLLSEQDETPRSKDRSATNDGMLSVDRDDERETARDEQETERCRPAARPLPPTASHMVRRDARSAER